jgi:predicted nucleotidyltransferase
VTSTEPTRLLGALGLVAQALDEQGAAWALVGGLAVSMRVEPRFTRDIDVAVSVVDDAAAERLVSSLQAKGFALKTALEQQAIGRLAAVRLLPPGESAEGIIVDLLFVSSGIEPEICRDAEVLEIAPGLTVPVARAGHLAAMKLLAQSPERPQDALDLRALLAEMRPEEVDRVRLAIRSIVARGTNRGKALQDDLDKWLSSR